MSEPRRVAQVLHCAMVAIAGLWLASWTPAARAQDTDDAPQARVGRVAVAQGELYIAPQERAEEWAGVGLNHPIATGDNLWMSGEGRAEVDYGGGQFRLGPDSNVHVSRLDDAELALFVAQGRVVVRVRALDPGESARIDTPNAQIQLVRPGLYRIDVSPEPRQTWVVVREGAASVVLQSGVQDVLPGQTANIAGAGGGAVEVRNGAGIDALDGWSAERDRVYERGRNTTAYVSRQMVGYADLDTNGSWQSYPEYGAVWFPTTVVADWAPYRYGRWVWLAAYGWTWVDDAPWGYAPFHYGRWAHIGGRWGWCPGTFVARPVWAPALVAWYGGSGWGYSISVGGPVFGWVPLGWRDPFVPYWGRCSSRCYARYNRPYAVDVSVRPRQPPAVYVNARVPNAVTAVPANALRETRPVQASRVPLPAQGLANAPLLAASPTVKPVVLSTRVVQPGRGAPQPAGEIAARVRPQALSPFAGAPSAPLRERQGDAAPVTAVPPAAGLESRRGGAPVNAVPPAASVESRRGTPPVTAVPPATSVESRRGPPVTYEGGRNGTAPRAVTPDAGTTRQMPTAPPPGAMQRERAVGPGAVNAVPPAGPPVVRQAPLAQPERSVRAVPPPAVAPPPQVRSVPQAPVSAVPPAAVPRAAAPPPPQQSQQPSNREAPVQRPGQGNGPRQQQN